VGADRQGGRQWRWRQAEERCILASSLPEWPPWRRRWGGVRVWAVHDGGARRRARGAARAQGGAVPASAAQLLPLLRHALRGPGGPRGLLPGRRRLRGPLCPRLRPPAPRAPTASRPRPPLADPRSRRVAVRGRAGLRRGRRRRRTAHAGRVPARYRTTGACLHGTTGAQRARHHPRTPHAARRRAPADSHASSRAASRAGRGLCRRGGGAEAAATAPPAPGQLGRRGRHPADIAGSPCRAPQHSTSHPADPGTGPASARAGRAPV
jgi:hypothetical protein